MQAFLNKNTFNMLIVIGSMFAGIALGILLRKRRLPWISTAITLFIWVLLFLLGVNTGVNKTVVSQLTTIGWDTLIITFGAISGSLFFAWLLWVFVINKQERENE